MNLSKIIKKKLDGREIKSKDQKIYRISVVGKESFSIWVKSKDEQNRYGFMEEIRDLGKELYLPIVADFTRISGKGLYKETIKLLSQVMPSDTSFRNEVANFRDKENLLKYTKEHQGKLNQTEALSKTIFGHILLSSSFTQVSIEYVQDDHRISGAKALEEFSSDHQRNQRKGCLYLIGKK